MISEGVTVTAFHCISLSHPSERNFPESRSLAAPMQIQAEPGRPPGDLVPPPQDVEPVLHELLSPLWINFEKSCKKEKSFLFGHWLGELIMPDLKIHSKGDF